MEQMTRIHLRVDEIQDFVQPTIDNKKGKHVSFSNQVPSQATANPKNQGASSNQIHNMNHVQVNKEAVKMTLAISSLRSGKDLLTKRDQVVVENTRSRVKIKSKLTNFNNNS